jgi:capsular exopolysaccharide synthesis family protein
MGLITGLGLAIGFVLVRESTDRSIKAPGEAHFHLKLPELGVIPSSIESKLPGTMQNTARGSIVALEMNGSTAISERDRVELVTWQDKASAVAESFRNTLASILFSQQYADRPRVILITSPGRAEGKSTMSSNLAIALAEINQRVLLIDGDIRKSNLHKLFDVSNSWGLSDLLRERTPLQDCPLEALARKTVIEGLYVLPCGPGTLNISSLLYSGRMAELLQRARMLFDTIVIDTPPILYVSDSRILARLADAAVLVIRAGVTTRDAAIAAKERFDNDGIPLLGVVLNDWDLKSKSPHSHAGYGYGYENRAARDGDEPSPSKKTKAASSGDRS